MLFATIVEQQDRCTTCGERRLRNEREVDRIFRVLAVNHQPGVDLRFTHQLRQQRVESFGQVAVDRFDPIAMRRDGADAIEFTPLVELTGDCEGKTQAGEQENDSTQHDSPSVNGGVIVSIVGVRRGDGVIGQHVHADLAGDDLKR